MSWLLAIRGDSAGGPGSWGFVASDGCLMETRSVAKMGDLRLGVATNLVEWYCYTPRKCMTL